MRFKAIILSWQLIFVVDPNVKSSDSNDLTVTSLKSKHGIKKRGKSGDELYYLTTNGYRSLSKK